MLEHSGKLTTDSDLPFAGMGSGNTPNARCSAMKNANYRKYNDRTHNSSTYHKKDGTPVRTLLKRESEEEISEARNEHKRIKAAK